ncbi:phosphoglycolate phosphatase [Nioella sp.]|jgi:phosphoglycolate phosphatase|uniref:phosphoglycolate phosphatase n=1 Tax=Nioella sp. TaxID=1912091 RepID=UPI003A89F50B
MTTPSVSARIVFDLDGTLIDSAPDIHAIANEVLALEGCAAITLEETRRFVGNGAAVFVARMRGARGLPDAAQERMHDAFVARYDRAVGRTHPYPGVAEALSDLQAAGHRLGICTNKPIKPALAVLAHLGLDRFFGTVIGGDSLIVKKPDPAPLEAAFEALGQGPMIYVGDSEVDAETAERLGVPFLLFTEGYRKTPVNKLPHAAAFDDFKHLGGLVDNLLKR